MGEPIDRLDPSKPLGPPAPPDPKDKWEVRDSSCPGVRAFRLGVQFIRSDISKSGRWKSVTLVILLMIYILMKNFNNFISPIRR